MWDLRCSRKRRQVRTGSPLSLTPFQISKKDAVQCQETQQLSLLCPPNAIFLEEQTMWQAPSHLETAHMTNLWLCLKSWKPCYTLSPSKHRHLYLLWALPISLLSAPPIFHLELPVIWFGAKISTWFLVELHQKQKRGEFSEQLRVL